MNIIYRRLGMAVLWICIVIVASLQLLPAHAAGPWYVAPNGNDGNSCASTDTPCATINAAITKASAGDVIYIAAGTYTGAENEVINLGRSVKLIGGWNLTFTAQVGVSTIDGQTQRRGVVINTCGGSQVIVAELERFRIVNGYGDSSGGGVYIPCNGTFVTLRRTIISDNQAGNACCTGGGGGGGIYGGQVVTLTQSTVSHNSIVGGFSGAGIFNLGTLIIDNSTISGNAPGQGIYNLFPSAWLTLTNSTINNNGVGVTNVAGHVRMRNSIIADNQWADCYNNLDGYSGTVISLGYNLIEGNSGCTLLSSDLSGIDPKLGPLQDNGGSTLTHALEPTSPAINAGDPAGCLDAQGNAVTVDQRHGPRAGRCDIGAYEANLVVTKDVVGDFRPGKLITYTITLNNVTESIELTDVTFADDLPAELTYLPDSLSVTNGTGQASATQVTWSGTVFSDTASVVTFGAMITDTIPLGTWITNTVTGSWTGLTASANATLGVFARVFLPICLHNYCPDFFDDFRDATSGWPVGEDTFVRFGYLNGEYQVLSKQGGYLYLFQSPACIRENYVVEADARWVGAPGDSYGLIFSVTSNFSQYYLFYISVDYGEYGLFRRDPGGFVVIQPFTASAAIKRIGLTNHLKVIRNGSQITLAVNGTVLGTWSDGTIGGYTRAGIYSSPYENRPTSDARFDNFSMATLAASAVSAPGLMTATPDRQALIVVNRAGLPAHVDWLPNANKLHDAKKK